MDGNKDFSHKSDERLIDEIKFLQIRITELEKAESRHRAFDQLLRKTQFQQKAILNNIPDIAWLKDSNSCYILVNDAFAKECRTGRVMATSPMAEKRISRTFLYAIWSFAGILSV